MENSRGPWPTRLNELFGDRRTALAVGSAAVAVLLIVGGIAFASQVSNGTDNQAQGVQKPSSKSNGAKSSTGKSGNSSRNQASAATKPGDTTTSTIAGPPVTIVGPNGEIITVPPTTPPSNSGISDTTVTASPSVTPDSSGNNPSTVPESNPTSPPTTRPLAHNGPSVPTADVTVASQNPEDPHASLKVDAADADGFVTSIVVDWNDGTSPTTFNYSLSGCSDTGGGTPSSSHTENPDHTYANANSYDVTVTVTSVGCDNGGQQQAISTQTIVVGGTTPDTTPATIIPPILPPN